MSSISILDDLRVQRLDDHRYYHRSRINQTLHLISAMSFVTAYVMLFINPAIAVLLGWFVAMFSRQLGHFFFEPKGYDDVNQATHEHKEEIKVGYNLRRKIVLLSAWALCPALLWASPSLGGLVTPHVDGYGFVENLCTLWLGVAAVAVVFRTIHLFFLRNVRTGLVWFLKILTDPFHDIHLYHRSPLHLLRGELLDPMLEVRASRSSHARAGG